MITIRLGGVDVKADEWRKVMAKINGGMSVG